MGFTPIRRPAGILAGELGEHAVELRGIRLIGRRTVVVVVLRLGLRLVELAADAAGNDVHGALAHKTPVLLPLERHLKERRVRVGGHRVAAEDPVAAGVEDQAAVVLLDRLQAVGVAAVDQIRPRVDAGVGQVGLGLVRGVVELLAPVQGADDVLRAVGPELFDGGDGLVFVRREVLAGAVHAELQPVRGLDDLRLALFAKGHAVLLKRGPGAVRARLVAVHHVVVGGGHEVDPGGVEDLCILGRREEGEVDLRIVVGQAFVRERALAVGDRELVVRVEGERVVGGVGVVPCHHALEARRMLGVVGVGPERAVAQQGDDKLLLRLGRGLRGGLGRGLRRGRRLGSDHGGGNGLRRGFDLLDALLLRDARGGDHRRLHAELFDEEQLQAQQEQTDHGQYFSHLSFDPLSRLRVLQDAERFLSYVRSFRIPGTRRSSQAAAKEAAVSRT